MSFSIREVRAADVPAVKVLVAETLAEFGLTFGQGSETDAQILELPRSFTADGGQFWVALADDGHLLGTAGLFVLDPKTVELRKMYLHPSARGLGIGHALFERVVAHARGLKADRIVLDTVAEMKRAIAFYEAHGFVRDDTFIRGARCTRGYVLSLI